MQLMRDKPSQLNKIYDQHTRSKVPMGRKSGSRR